MRVVGSTMSVGVDLIDCIALQRRESGVEGEET